MSSFRRALALMGKLRRVQTSRSFYSTPFSAARPPTRSPRLRREATPAARLGSNSEDALPPMVILQSASMSGAMDISPKKAIEVLQRYQELEKGSHPGWEARLCTDFDIKPTTLVLLSKILNRCPNNSQRHLARRVMLSASALGDESATIDLVSSGIRSGKMSDYALPLKRLGAMAEEGKPQAMRLLGRLAASQGNDAEALEWFRKATQESAQMDFEDAGEALVTEGQILQKSNRRDAEAAFRKAALEFDNPSAYLHLALLQKEDSPEREIYLLKAASSGVIEAAYQLGCAEVSKAKATGDNPPPSHGMAREWFQIAAADGHGPSMLSLAQISKDIGESHEGLQWLEKAKKVKGVREQALKMEEGWQDSLPTLG